MKSEKPKFQYVDHSEGTARRARQRDHIAASQKKARERAELENQENRKALTQARKEWQQRPWC